MIEGQKGTDPQPAPRHHRRHWRSHLVNHDVRLRLVLDDAIFALAAALLAIGILYYLSNKEIGDSMWSAHLSIKQTRELLTNGVKVAGIVTFIAVLVFGIWSLIDAHRIAGPLHRLHRLLNEIGDGNLKHEIAFRKRDEFGELAAAADRLVEIYAERIGTVRDRAQSLEQELNSETLSPEQIARLRRQAADLTGYLSFFQLPDSHSKPAIDDTPLA